MRTLDPAYAAHIAGGATTLATCWRLTRRDGVVLGFTDHDLPLAFGDTRFVPSGGLDGSSATTRLGAQVDTSEVVGILAGAAITEDDILLGRYDGAVVETFRVNWRDTSVRDLVGRASIGEVTRQDGRFKAELRAGQAAYNAVGGRIYQSLCDAELGDRRCTIDLADPRYRATAAVTALRDRQHLAVSGLSGFDEGWFGFGTASWSAGRRQGVLDRVQSHARLGGVDILGFDAPVGDWVALGDTLTVTAGCDRNFATCKAKFANFLNFRGFPHIPGNDIVLTYAQPGTALDGAPLVG